MWLDTHAHLTAEPFDADRDAVIERAQQAGVETIVAIGAGYGIDHNRKALELAARDPRVFATVGVHPHDAKQLDDAGREGLRAWLGHPRVVAVGECGLDYHYTYSPRASQRAVFAEQVAWARETGLPVSIHVRDDGPEAYEEVLDILRGEGRGDVQGVLHCYTGTLEFAERAIQAGLWISFSGILTFKKDRGLREVARRLPLSRLLVETDCPLLAPEGYRGRRNEPARVALVGAALAAAQGCDVEAVARATTHNARSLFRLPAPGSDAS
ncbi:MAG: TatD family hydrolase [Deltaproteobacteria bacterium]|nr:MAG: TatD family hydrolase [Deltaproteobacteria bacterium]